MKTALQELNRLADESKADRLSDDQRDAITELENAGAHVYVAHDFQGFYDWFVAEFLTAPFAYPAHQLKRAGKPTTAPDPLIS